ncbi:MAG TPA: methylated-DNA--[protein]-cysteine S-methyltransferase [Bdellovibrionales bacterium]|nr:methylated-DNA--[protein]-cysteine S-methyltransferase [Bdellovibrionales bacterium]
MTYHYSCWTSPIGRLHMAASPTHLVALAFDQNWAQVRARLEGELVDKDTALFKKLRAELTEYFGGRRRHLTTPVRLEGTPFQLAAWRALRKIPFGRTRSYAEQARAAGFPAAVRAIAAANARNPISILIPCHRLLGAGGQLTGYGGGLECKRRLLALEAGGVSKREKSRPSRRRR